MSKRINYAHNTEDAEILAHSMVSGQAYELETFILNSEQHIFQLKDFERSHPAAVNMKQSIYMAKELLKSLNKTLDLLINRKETK